MRAVVFTCRGPRCANGRWPQQLLAALLPPLRAHQLQAPRMHVDDTTLLTCPGNLRPN